MNEVIQLRDSISAYIYEAIEVEKAGLKVQLSEVEKSDYPQELIDKMEMDEAFGTAFENLTPGRKRGYLLQFNGTKQAKTRIARMEKVRKTNLEWSGVQ